MILGGGKLALGHKLGVANGGLTTNYQLELILGPSSRGYLILPVHPTFISFSKGLIH